MPLRHVQINRGLLETAVPQQQLNRTQVCAVLEQMGGEAVPQGVRMQGFLDISPLGGFTAGVPDDLGVDGMGRRMPLSPQETARSPAYNADGDSGRAVPSAGSG